MGAIRYIEKPSQLEEFFSRIGKAVKEMLHVLKRLAGQGYFGLNCAAARTDTRLKCVSCSCSGSSPCRGTTLSASQLRLSIPSMFPGEA
jgi:hypothetical protein